MSKVEYVSKNYDKLDEPWLAFGAPTKSEYEKWSPEVCGICCIKMIGDTYGLTNRNSLYSLTMECLSLGGYKIIEDGSIQGVFYKPLLELARIHGLDGKVEKNIEVEKITSILLEEKYVILSIDKKKVNPSFSGGHLVLIHAYNSHSNTFCLNDPEPILAENGLNVELELTSLQKISNNRGLIIYKRNNIPYVK